MAPDPGTDPLGADENPILRCWQAIRRSEAARNALSPGPRDRRVSRERHGGTIFADDRPALVAYLRAVFEQDRRGVPETFR